MADRSSNFGVMPSREAEIVRLKGILREAQSQQGNSPAKDAWRRLCRNKAAYSALMFLLTVMVTAFLTPLLPLQAPAQQRLKKESQYQPPTFRGGQLDLGMTWEELLTLEENIASLKRQIRTTTDREAREVHENSIIAMERKHPIERNWPNVGPVAWQMIRVRLAIFKTWAIPSICGTDELGRDLLSRMFWALRVSLIVGLVATSVSLVIGVAYGATSAFFGGWTDRIMMRLVDVLYSVPFIFVVIYALTIFSAPQVKGTLEKVGIDRMTLFYVLIGAIFWLTMARVVRGQVLSMKQEQFVDAARTMGASSFRIIFLHLVPNVLGVVVVYLTLTIPSVILFESFLSFVGFGVQPPDVSLGLLVNEGVRVITPIKIHWWLVFFPGLVLASTLLALNVLGDGLRDVLDPRLKNR